jgi:N-acetylglucosaminyldiphosphoundecaprenol N-acetyl-beta-D-mannosaminyltransferase
VELDGVPIHVLDEAASVSAIIEALEVGDGGWVITYNSDILRRFTRDPAFAELAREATLNVADGMPLVWAARLAGVRLPGRVCGSDLLSSLSARAAHAGRSIYLLGGNPGTAEASARLLGHRHPALKISGHLCPPFGFERDPAAVAAVVEAVAGATPDIVFVGLGSPKQDQLIQHLRRDLPGAWFLGVGVAFSFMAGDVPRAPGWMRATGLEWLHRMLQEPARLFRRYVIHDAPYVAGLLVRTLGRRLLGRPARSGRLPA